MPHTHHIHIAIAAQELESLFVEISLYLEAVDAFRREGHEPSWRLEEPAEVLR